MSRIKEIISYFKEVWEQFSQDNAFRLASSLAYYTVFSIAPIIVIVIAVVGYFFGREAIQGEVFAQLEGMLGPEAAQQTQEMVKNAYLSDKSTMATVIGIVTLLLGATGVFNQLKDSLNVVWEMKPQPKNGIWAFIKNRILSFGIIIVIGFILLISLVLNALVTAFTDVVFSDSVTSEVLVQIIHFVVSLIVTGGLFAVIFKMLPDAVIEWRDVLVGALITALLFALGKYLISLYLAQTDFSESYGAAGALVVLLLWTNYSAIILIFGAEMTFVYAKRYGTTILPNQHAVKVYRRELTQQEMEERLEKKKAENAQKLEDQQRKQQAKQAKADRRKYGVALPAPPSPTKTDTMDTPNPTPPPVPPTTTAAATRTPTPQKSVVQPLPEGTIHRDTQPGLHYAQRHQFTDKAKTKPRNAFLALALLLGEFVMNWFISSRRRDPVGKPPQKQ